MKSSDVQFSRSWVRYYNCVDICTHHYTIHLFEVKLCNLWSLQYNMMKPQVDLCPFKVTHTQFSSRVLRDQHFSLDGTLSQPLTSPNMDKNMHVLHSLLHNYSWIWWMLLFNFTLEWGAEYQTGFAVSKHYCVFINISLSKFSLVSCFDTWYTKFETLYFIYFRILFIENGQNQRKRFYEVTEEWLREYNAGTPHIMFS